MKNKIEEILDNYDMFETSKTEKELKLFGEKEENFKEIEPYLQKYMSEVAVRREQMKR